jgi:hypothetical protein
LPPKIYDTNDTIALATVPIQLVDAIVFVFVSCTAAIFPPIPGPKVPEELIAPFTDLETSTPIGPAPVVTVPEFPLNPWTVGLFDVLAVMPAFAAAP